MTLQEHDERIREEGRREGLQEGKIKILAELCRDGALSAEEAALKAEMTLEEFQRAAAELAE